MATSLTVTTMRSNPHHDGNSVTPVIVAETRNITGLLSRQDDTDWDQDSLVTGDSKGDRVRRSRGRVGASAIAVVVHSR